ncbi:hypothetical protein PR202_ga11970 [Eleusine coracana subsp. coracana]|uniref:non-specific serine/threonine protein kinase n=1 Tax=Eleusine coracana subsp. coracana TaxID=191504 RepID=A0AAV5CAN1_ELECO|nr:hypothetical protein PR202_ga11970 [Eleusine coracana subsp. coracana]
MAGESNWELERILLDIKADRAEPRHLPLEFLKDITRDFSDDLELGRGGFGVVYKGVLKNGEIVAVKRLKAALGIVDKQFENEAHLLRLKHENIVRFLGHCSESRHVVVKHEGRDCIAESQEKLLCLEYMPNGSLDRHIKDASSGLNWNERYKIIKGICSGLHFLHDENQTNTPVIHTDLKPANILLTSEMIPKITDFGLSRLFGEQQTRTYTESRGTHGYMAREFLLHGKITKKSDIFSLGVIVLEMITGNRDYPWSNGTTLPQDYVKHVRKFCPHAWYIL